MYKLLRLYIENLKNRIFTYTFSLPSVFCNNVTPVTQNCNNVTGFIAILNADYMIFKIILEQIGTNWYTWKRINNKLSLL
jgi:hypothetical protein